MVTVTDESISIVIIKTIQQQSQVKYYHVQ